MLKYDKIKLVIIFNIPLKRKNCPVSKVQTSFRNKQKTQAAFPGHMD